MAAANPKIFPIDPIDPIDPGGGGAINLGGPIRPIAEPVPEPVADPTGEKYFLDEKVDGKDNVRIDWDMTEGLVDNIDAIGNSKYANNNYGVGSGRASTRGVDQNELSQYQLEQMLASDSPLMRQAAAQGLARGGSRGLMNSSLSTGAAQGAMISGAQPFALQDASTYARTASENMAAQNTMEAANLRARTASMQARSARDTTVLRGQLQGYGDIGRGLMAASAREDQQRYGTSEREGTQGYNAEQNQLNRDWTSNENLMDRTLNQWQTQVDAGVKIGVSREQAFSTMYASIMTDTTKGFSADKKRQAIRDMNATLNARYNESGDIPPGPFESSWLDNPDNPDMELATEPFVPPGSRVDVYGGTTIITNPDGTMTINITSDMGDSQQIFASLVDV